AMQLVHRALAVPLAVHDLTAVAPDEQHARLAAFLAGERRRALPLGDGPLFRATAHILAAERWSFTLCFHPAILDGWSIAKLFEELFGRCVADERADRAPLATTFRDFVAAEAALAGGDNARAADAFWAGQLEGATPVPPPSGAPAGEASVVELA